MDQIKIGKFIASCRKEQGMTQAVLAEKLGISDRAISKWETGKSMPDSGIMLDLCELLKINVNELLSGERIMAEAYDKRAEENLLAMRREVEEKNRQMLRTEYWIAFPSVIAGLVMVFVASFIEMPVWLRIVLIVFALVMIFTVAFIAVGIEQKAGYYECQNCHHRYVPTYWQTSLESLKQVDDKKTAVDISWWKEFAIGDLFDKLNLGIKNPQFNKALDVSEEQTDEFNLPLVNAKHGNNGIMFYGRKEDFETASMTIDIVQNGTIATGDVYAQPQETGVLWDAYLIKLKHEIKSEYTLMFLAVVIERAIKERFSYDDKCVWDKASLLKVKLPVDSHGCPDWAYMQGIMQKSELCIKQLKQAFV
ncbi:helix-turn-helix domain-containing protein [Hornefia butyriciproducens]|uniref:helix-turn-helix domain-containing protein n=1 Tax=Hornefia butyriciproducens TaxID=2652293 RepID=UPI003D0438FD